MNLTRRIALLSFLTGGISIIANRFQTLKAQVLPLLSENNLTKKWFINNELNQEILYQHFLELAQGGVEDKPVLMYQGINTSPYQDQINQYPDRLLKKPDHKNIISTIKSDQSFSSYPVVGKLPKIDENGLDFLHEDIKEACVCLGSFADDKFQTKWLGRNAFVTGEFWSTTKIIPLLNLIARTNKKTGKDINNYAIKGVNSEGNEVKFSFTDLAQDVISYEQKIASSNSLGAMFKRFIPQIELEQWVKSITGNQDIVFRGRYGENPFIDQPYLIDSQTEEIIFSPDPENPRWACNEISAYDLTRLISMVGWHNYLPQNSRFPEITSPSIETLIKILGNDPARLTDLAIQSLGLENDLDSVVIISKEGDGATGTRSRTEAVYVALINLIDRRFQPAKQLTISLAMRGGIALNPRNLDQEVVNLDARMATEITKLLWKFLNNL
jgi:hypothetical protein